MNVHIREHDGIVILNNHKSATTQQALVYVDHTVWFEETQILSRNCFDHICREAIEIWKQENNFNGREECLTVNWAYKRLGYERYVR